MSNDHFYVALILLLATAPLLFQIMENEYLKMPIPEEGSVVRRGIRAPFNFLYDGRTDADLIKSRFVPVLKFDQEAYTTLQQEIEAIIFSPGTSSLGVTDEQLDAILGAPEVFTRAQLVIKAITFADGAQPTQELTELLDPSLKLGLPYTDSNIWKLLKDIDSISSTYPSKTKEREDLLTSTQSILVNLQNSVFKLINTALGTFQDASAERPLPTSTIQLLSAAYAKRIGAFFLDPVLPEALMNQLLTEPPDREAIKKWLHEKLLIHLQPPITTELAENKEQLAADLLSQIQQKVLTALTSPTYFSQFFDTTSATMLSGRAAIRTQRAELRSRLRDTLNIHVFGEQKTRQEIDKLLTDAMKQKLMNGLERVYARNFKEYGSITDEDRQAIIKVVGLEDPQVKLDVEQNGDSVKTVRLNRINSVKASSEDIAAWFLSEPVLSDEVLTYYWKIIRALPYRATYLFDRDRAERQLQNLYLSSRSHYYRRGEVIVPAGELIDAGAKLRLKAMAEQRPRFFMLQGLIAAVAGSAVLFAFAFYIWRFHGYELRNRRVIPFLLAMIVLFAQILRIGTWYMPFAVPIVPIGFLAVQATLALNRRFGFTLISMSSIFLVLASRETTGTLIFLILVGFAAAHGAGRCVENHLVRARRSFPAIALKVAVVSVAALILSLAWEGTIRLPSTLAIDGLKSLWLLVWNIRIESETGPQLAKLMIGTFVAAGGWTLLGFYTFQPLERFLGTASALRLAAFKDPTQNPLLEMLSREAPGTFRHSQRVAELVKSAALAINANSDLVQVSALYHDIGKSLRPEHFGENLEAGRQNPHDLLPPRESARIIIQHVIQGERLAREHNVPVPVIDLLKQHHGTSVVYYFYRAALDQAQGEPVDRRDFQYPGPIPQTPEAVILMVADSVEATFQAATRAGKIRAYSDIDNLVRDIIEERRKNEQFIDSGITDAQLKQIHHALYDELVRMTSGNRPEYPKINLEENHHETHI